MLFTIIVVVVLQVHVSLLTALHLASQNNHMEVARLLISAGARLDLKDSEGKVHTHTHTSYHRPALCAWDRHNCGVLGRRK